MPTETWSKSAASRSAVPPRIVLIGDSHMGMIANALDEIGVPYAGGAIMQASQWHHPQFVLVEDGFFVPTDDAAKARWKETWQQNFANCRQQDAKDFLIITNIGMHSNMLYSDQEFGNFLKGVYRAIPTAIGMHDISNYMMRERALHLALMRKFIVAGYKVIWVSDPPTQTTLPDLFATFDKTLSAYFEAIGCSVFNAREWIQRRGGFPAEFKSAKINPDTGAPDLIHGSDEYYRELLKEIFEKNSIFHPASLT